MAGDTEAEHHGDRGEERHGRREERMERRLEEGEQMHKGKRTTTNKQKTKDIKKK